MNRFWRALAVIAAVVGILIVSPASAHAEDDETPSDWAISRYDVAIRTDANGMSTVTVNVDFDFGQEPSHGILMYFLQRQEVADNPDVWRQVDISLGAITSSTGAPTGVETSTEDGALVARIGDANQTVSGTQSYTVTYTARGLIAPDQAVSGMDEFNYSVIGTGWQVPIHNVTVSVTGPTTVKQAACFSGDSYDQACEANSNASTATYSVSSLEPGEGMQVVAGFPVGTFAGAEPRFTKRYHPGNTFPLTPLSGGLTGVLASAGVIAVVLRTRRSRRDEVYLGLAPGMRPAPGEEAAVGYGSSSGSVTVAFTPPKNARPGEIGVLLDATADDVDVTATILDLAVRGHIQIVELGSGEWRFLDRGKPGELTEAERHIMAVMFSNGPQVTTTELASEGYANLLPGTRNALYNRVTKELRWFTARPTQVLMLALAAGFGLMLVGVAVSAVLALTVGLGLVGLAFVVTGLAVVVSANKFGRRTAEGSAVLAEAKGFELYLSTAEADQIAFEEGIDVFSRYLPYATVFGVADRWAAIFADLARQGRYRASDWYVGPQGYFYGDSFTQVIGSFSHSISQSMQSSIQGQSQINAATSGGSGFSGGGGFGGGGGGGW